ncbi:MAG: hypothetical protein IJY09_07880 [Lachnospiraceae bacterium]|nr:hypothetical protein [Lachnospiraceae bacterium]
MAENQKVVKMKKRVKLNIGTLIFIFIVVYLGASIIYSSHKKSISLYEVIQEDLAQNITLNGVITREETLYYADAAGYINYYITDGSRVKKNATICSIDANRSVYDMLGADSVIDFTADDMLEMKRYISAFTNEYSGSNFESIYDLKEKLSGKISELSDQKLLNQMQEIVDSNGITTAFQFVNSEQAGVVSYISDSYDGLTTDMIQSSIWDNEAFVSNSLRTLAPVAVQDAVYKLVTSDDWQITCLLTMEQYVSLQEYTQLQFTILEDDFTLTAPVEFIIKGSEYYMQISMSRYMVNYLSDRFLTLELVLKDASGLKIPQSAIANREFYLIPLNCLTMGGDSATSLGITLVTYDTQTGEPFFEFNATEIFYRDENYAYIEKEDIPLGTMILSQKTDETTGMVTDEVIPINMTGELEGVYCVNKGYAQFRRIERIESNEQYVIIKKDTSRGISVYDHIALDAETVINSSIIY